MIPLIVTIEKAGGTLVFDPPDIESCSYVNSASLDGDTVQSDELTVVIRQSPDGWRERWNNVNKGNPVLLKTPTRSEKYYFKDVIRIGRDRFQLTAQSPVGRLVSDFPGGLYDGTRGLPDVIADVIGDIIPYDCDPRLEAVLVSGWAPYQSRRETLHALAFAYGFLIRRDENQNLFFTVPPETSYRIPKSAVFGGGKVDYRIGGGYARVDITAKEFYEDSAAQEQILFDNSSGGAPANHLTVIFNSPAYGFALTGNLTIDTEGGKELSGANYAVVSGSGTLSGKLYAISSSVVSVPGDADADPENVLTISDAPFVTTLNADSIGEKLLSSQSAEVVSMNILRSNQRPGDLVTFVNPFGDEQTGYIESLSGSVTSLDRAAVTALCGYVPSWGAAYDAVFVLKSSGEWTVPAYLDGKAVRVVLIGGGSGGASGQHGTDEATINGQTVKIEGGGRGLPGRGGRILAFKLKVSAGETYSYQCGEGGAGGSPVREYDTDEESGKSEYRSVPGSEGGDTTFGAGAYSSANGAVSGAGFYDIIDKIRYATPGPDNGADGGQATSGKETGNRQAPQWTDVQRYVVAPDWAGSAAQSWHSGGEGGGYWWHYDADETGSAYDAWAYGGLGGGGAVGAAGEDGADAPYSGYGTEGGAGGNGAAAKAIFPPDPLPPGSGGSGGHGGGEGGVGGSGNTTEPGGTAYNGRRGYGGSGSAGQPGANGCILIYYHNPDSTTGGQHDNMEKPQNVREIRG